MDKARLLIVEDDVDVANMLRVYFAGLDYQVDVAHRGQAALEKTRQVLPHLIVLDIMLPDLNGYEVCRRLRTSMRTSHIPIIFLSQKDERGDKLQGLELGADDYVTKPFDIEELKLRVQGAIRRSERESLTDPRSGLPAGRLIEDQLRRIIRETGWALLDIRINQLEPFKDVYGFVAGDEAMRFTAMLINEVVDELGSGNDFVGHAGGDNFIVITSVEAAPQLKKRLKRRFASEIQSHYGFMDRLQGFMVLRRPQAASERVPFMTLSVGVISPSQEPFSDIREITEVAAEARRQDAPAVA